MMNKYKAIGILVILTIFFINPKNIDADYQEQTKDGDTFIADNRTTLIWEVKTAENKNNRYTYEEAEIYCDQLTLGGYTDWRLPTIKELNSILDVNTYNPSIDTYYFRNTVASLYWSSTAYAYIYDDYAWGINFRHGLVYYISVLSDFYVRCVR
jgi:hypothetical protein